MTILLGMGNPLLDITATAKTELLQRYGLEANNAILAEEKHLPLYAELRDKYAAEFCAGGATQNAIRVAQWMLQQPGATAFFGAIGRDDFADKMAAAARADGVQAQYAQTDAAPTGTCAVIVSQGGACRSLVANLAAAEHYPVSHLRDAAQWSVVEQARLFYIAGFFLTVSPESVAVIGEHVAAHAEKTLCMNLSAPFLLEVPLFFERFQAALPYVDVYFGNESEARTLAKQMQWHEETGDDVEKIALALATRTAKKTSRPRTVVFTQGAEPTVVVVGDRQRVWSVHRYGVLPCGADELLDSNGAGDAFVGGFLAMMARGRALDACCAAGNYAAHVVIRRSGCTFDGARAPSFTFRGQHVVV